MVEYVERNEMPEGGCGGITRSDWNEETDEQEGSWEQAAMHIERVRIDKESAEDQKQW